LAPTQRNGVVTATRFAAPAALRKATLAQGIYADARPV
jgi:hypothetical protein